MLKYIFSMVGTKICVLDEKINIFANQVDENIIEDISSNPIYVYKLMKEMNWFYENFYVAHIDNSIFEPGK